MPGSRGRPQDGFELAFAYLRYVKVRRPGVMMKGTKAVAGMNIKRLVFGVCVAFVLCAFVGVSVASARTIYVPDDYAKIRWAVDNATAGDTIIVRSGTYIENVVVSKSLEIRSYSQNPSDTVVKAYNSNDHVFYVTADNVTIKGFTVTGATGFQKAGVYLLNSKNSRIENVNASNNNYGIYLYDSSNNIITYNNASNNDYGIYLQVSSNNTITYNNASNNYHGIRLYESSNNTITYNNASNNYDDGIYLYDSSNNTIAYNNASNNNDEGIYLYESSNNIITNNNASNNYYGIYLCDSSNNTLANNSMTDNTYNFILIGWQDSHFDNNIDTTNTVDGKPIYYIKNASNKVYDGSTNAGVFYCIWCNNVTVKNLNLTKNGYGVFFWKTNNSRIENINASNNYYGIYLDESSN
ncbi:MAG: right-handed parallel beta-helix repeat-containing protein, partial [Candidatus Methanospirare jalkutatii]